MQRLAIISALIAAHLSPLASSAAVPLRWTVETSRVQPVSFDAVRGETLELEAAFNSYGKAVATSNQTAFLCWQTNGMGNAWWTTNAVTTANVARALFTPAMDPGAPTVQAFIGVRETGGENVGSAGGAFGERPLPATSYRASFMLRFRHGPGEVPNAIELPPKVLDLAHTTVVNPPWPTQADFAETTTAMRVELKGYVDGQISGAGLVSPSMTTNIAGRVASNVVTKAYVEGLGIESGIDTNAVRAIVDEATNAVPRIVMGASSISADMNVSVIEGFTEWNPNYFKDPDLDEYKIYSNIVFSSGCWYIGKYFKDPEGGISEWTLESLYSADEYYVGEVSTRVDPNATVLKFKGGMITSTRQIEGKFTRLATTNDVAAAVTNLDAEVASHATRLSSMSQQVTTLNEGYTRLYNFSTGATNANFTATNYPPTAAAAAAKVHWDPEEGMDFSDVPASLQLNERRDGAWRTVMDTRDWTVWYYRFKERKLTNEIARLKAENAALSNRIARAQAWANFTANGVENPMDDTLVVDRPNMWLMADYEWQKCVSGSNSCWVIRAKNVALSGGANTNGFLEICDAFGKPYMRVNKSAETLADAVFSEIYFDDDEGAWYVIFGNQTKPTKGGANCNIVGSSSGGGKCFLYDEDLPECPATITWPETAESHAGHWIMKAVPKPVNGVVPTVMFFGAEIKVAGRDYVEYIKEASFGAGIRVGNNVYEAVESGNTLIWQKKVD